MWRLSSIRWWVRLLSSLTLITAFPLLSIAFGQNPSPPPQYTALPATGPCGNAFGGGLGCFSVGVGPSASAVLTGTAKRQALSIANQSPTTSVACSTPGMGSPSVGAVGWTIPPLNVLVWTSAFVPNDEIDCAATSPVVVTVAAE